MFWEIFSFELKYHLKRPTPYILFALFFLFTFGMFSLFSLNLNSAYSNIHLNSPYIIILLLNFVNFFILFLIPAFISSSFTRDYELKTISTFYAAPVFKFDFIIGRFCGGLAIVFMILSGTVLAAMLAGFMPWVAPDKLGPFMISPYVQFIVLFILPNLFILGAICFSLSAWTRSMLFTYVGIIAFVAINTFAIYLAQKLEYQPMAGLLDSAGDVAFSNVTKYWTPAQKNSWMIPYSGSILYNRILWISMSFTLLAYSYRRFQFSVEKPRFFRFKKNTVKLKTPTQKEVFSKLNIPDATKEFSIGLYIKQFTNFVRVEFLSVIKSRSFILICLTGVLLNFISGAPGNEIYGTKTFPVTVLAIKAFYQRFQLFLTIVIIIYAGEMVWKERQLKLDGLYDSQPFPVWLSPVVKLTALVAIAAFMVIAFMASMMLLQIIEGYYHLEFLLYLKGLFFVWFPGLVFFCVMAVLLNVFASNKYAGHMLIAAYIAIRLIMLRFLNMEHYLYRFGFAPPARYSDMNGYGHFVSSGAWFFSYWGLVSILLLIIANLLWVRGAEDGFKIRLKNLKKRFTTPVASITAFSLVGAILCGSYIYYNTNVLNVYATQKDKRELGAAHEKLFKYIKDDPQPKITDIKCHVDIYPYKRKVDVRGTYILKNKTGSPIDTLYIWINPRLIANEIRIPDSRLQNKDNKFGYYAYKLTSPMMPSDNLQMDFNISSINSGFTNDGANVN